MNYETEAQDYLATRKTSTSTVAELTEFATEMVKKERERIADELDEQILCSASTSTYIDLAYYIKRLRNGGGDEGK